MKKTLRKFLIYLLAVGMLMPTWLVTGMMSATHVKAADPNTLVEWNFPDDTADAIADGGITENQSKVITSVGTNDIKYSYDGVTTQSARTTGWDGGNGLKYWLVEISTLGYKNIKLSSKQKSSDTGPKDFKVQYSVDSVVWTDVSGSIVSNANDKYIQGVLNDIVLPTVCNDSPHIYLRWIMISNLRVDQTSDILVASVGSSQIDDIKITGEEITNLTAYDAALAAVNKSDYTIASWTIYQGVVTTNVMTTANTQPEVAAATLAIVTAQNNLVTNAAADGLAAATLAATSEISNDYTQASWNTFSTAVIDALALDDTTNAQMLTKTTAINTAIANLVLKPAPVITNETVKSANTTSATITWTTDHAATSRVIYDTVSHGSLGTDNNYGYAFSSFTFDTTPMTVDHSVIIMDLTPGTKYYFRTVSYGSPEQVGAEMTFTTAEIPVAQVAAPAPVVEEAATIVSAAPAKAQAAAPQEEQKIETSSDDSNGQIKGDETSSDEEEKVNWTPWIVLFVLILLAGAATGGYFYWFNGEDEVKAVVKEPKKEEKKVEVAPKNNVKKANNKKKQKRW